jgi:hypothetical protein
MAVFKFFPEEIYYYVPGVSRGNTTGVQTLNGTFGPVQESSGSNIGSGPNRGNTRHGTLSEFVGTWYVVLVQTRRAFRV